MSSHEVPKNRIEAFSLALCAVGAIEEREGTIEDKDAAVVAKDSAVKKRDTARGENVKLQPL